MASQRFTKYSVNLSVGPWLIWREGVCHAFTLKKKRMEKTKLPVLQQWWQVNARCHGSLWSKTGRAVAASVSDYLLVMRLWFYIKFTLVRLCLDVCCSLPAKHSSSTHSLSSNCRQTSHSRNPEHLDKLPCLIPVYGQWMLGWLLCRNTDLSNNVAPPPLSLRQGYLSGSKRENCFISFLSTLTL